MINVPIIPPATPPRVQKSQVPEKNPHHEQNKGNKHDKDEEDNLEPEDEVVISGEEKTKGSPPEKPENPMQGHIDIEC